MERSSSPLSEATQHHMKAVQGKKKKSVMRLENWNCMCAFDWVFHLKGTAYFVVTFLVV